MEPNVRIRDYTLIRRLGGGGMGEVWEAYHHHLDRHVAIKCLSEELAHDSRIVHRFESEARIQANLDHLGIVRVHDGFVQDGRLFLVMQLIPGQTLAELLVTRGPCSLGQCMEWFRQVAAALAYVHSLRILHRDIKPSNIMVDSSGQAKLIDFGIALSQQRDSRLTRLGEGPGTPRYMSPEQYKGEEIDVPSDFYSLALTMQHVWTGSMPVRANDGSHAIAFPAGTPAAVERVFRKCLAARPDKRYSNAEDLASDISHAMMGRTVIRRRTILYVLAALLVLSLLGVGVHFLRGNLPSRVPNQIRIPEGEFVSGLSGNQVPEQAVLLFGEDLIELLSRRPVQRKHLPRFSIDKYEVTNAEYVKFVQETGWRAPPHWGGHVPPQGIANHPVVNVTWADAAAYARWAKKRLPTADEWEKAARGTMGRIYPWGNDFKQAKCNTDTSGLYTTAAVDAFPEDVSPYGVVGMGGNVHEWTATQDVNEDGSMGHVICGGSWLEAGVVVSIASFRRTALTMDLFREDLGFRCAK